MVELLQPFTMTCGVSTPPKADQAHPSQAIDQCDVKPRMIVVCRAVQNTLLAHKSDRLSAIGYARDDTRQGSEASNSLSHLLCRKHEMCAFVVVDERRSQVGLADDNIMMKRSTELLKGGQ